jgi:DNA-binding transcriptional regulator YbjK
MTSTPPSDKKKRTKSSVRHTRAIQLDRLKRPVADNLPKHVKTLFHEIVHPLTIAQAQHFHDLGLRERTLTLPVMMAMFLMAVWRQIAGVSELARLVRDEAAIWEMPVKVSQQAVSQRLRSLPPQLVLNILNALLPIMQARWFARQRPLPPEIAWAQERFAQCLIVDGSTLDALVKKVGLLRDKAVHPLAGKMTALLHLGSQLPHTLLYNPKADAHDQSFWTQIMAALSTNSLLLLDRGYTNFSRFSELTGRGVTFIIRAQSNLKYAVVAPVAATPFYRDTVVQIGSGETRQTVRLVELLIGTTWHRYLTNELDPTCLPARECVALYHRRWSIERSFLIVKRLLGLAYFWSGAQNAVEFQLWSIWIVYAVLIDLCDELAELLKLRFEQISIEMVYRSMYYYSKAVERGEDVSLPHFLQDRVKHLGLVKRKRKDDINVYESWGLTNAPIA